MEIIALDGGGDDAGADHEVAEFFALVAFFGVAGKDRSQERLDFGAGDVGFVKFAQALTSMAATEVNIVAIRTATDEADFGDVRAGATIGATSHADGDGIVVEADFFQGAF